MCRRRARNVAIGHFLLVPACVCAMLPGACARDRAVIVGFWFEPVQYSSSRLGGRLREDELETIAAVSRFEIAHAFAGLRVVVSDAKDARYRVRVLQDLWDPRFRSDVAVAGQSRALSLAGGDGAVNFSMLAGYAVSYAPAEADRAAIVHAIGTGVGRAAVHELVHQLLPTARIDDGDDVRSYEYGFAARREQYYGEMRWGRAWPALYQRFGASGSRRAR